MRFCAYMTPHDERPLLDVIRATGGRVIRLFADEWPPIPLTQAPQTCADDECLAIWYPDVIDEAELQHPECLPRRGPHGCYEGWALPLIVFQRQWYWKKQATIFAVELTYHAFRPNRSEDALFTADEVTDFESRLRVLIQHAFDLEQWCKSHLRRGYIGHDAWNQSEELRREGDRAAE